MKNLLINYGVIAIFYLVVVLGTIFLCSNNIHRSVNNNRFNTSSMIAK